MKIPSIKIRIQIEMTCSDCDGHGLTSGLAEAGNPGSAYEIDCDSCQGTGFQTQYISIDELKELLESGE